MDLVYYDPYPNQPLEEYLAEYNTLQSNYGAPQVGVKRVETVEEVLREADVRLRTAQLMPSASACRRAAFPSVLAHARLSSGQGPCHGCDQGSQQKQVIMHSPVGLCCEGGRIMTGCGLCFELRVELSPLWVGVQVVSLHCNLDEKTKHLMNKERLNMMKKDAILINAARGPVIDEVALVNHLKANPEFR